MPAIPPAQNVAILGEHIDNTNWLDDHFDHVGQAFPLQFPIAGAGLLSSPISPFENVATMTGARAAIDVQATPDISRIGCVGRHRTISDAGQNETSKEQGSAKPRTSSSNVFEIATAGHRCMKFRPTSYGDNLLGGEYIDDLSPEPAQIQNNSLQRALWPIQRRATLPASIPKNHTRKRRRVSHSSPDPKIALALLDKASTMADEMIKLCQLGVDLGLMDEVDQLNAHLSATKMHFDAASDAAALEVEASTM